MKIGIPREIKEGETRVALVPKLVPTLIKDGYEVLVETSAGAAASFPDEQYLEAGAQIVDDPRTLYAQSDVIFKVQPPELNLVKMMNEAEMMREGATYIGFLSPFSNQEVIEIFASRRITAFAIELIPRITRAQNMDALSSMATVAGYKAVLLASQYLGKMFPMLMTAAGTVTPATVLVLGAGVAGLQAIATARRLGAKVEAFDPRPAVKEQVKSLGASFVEMEQLVDTETKDGYAKELPEDFLKREMEVIGARLPKTDIVISTAQIFGKRAPVLISHEMVNMLRPGSVIVDLAAEQGGNCELTQSGQVITHKGVTIVGAENLPATVPVDASQLYSRNVFNLFKYLYPKPEQGFDVEDEVFVKACVTRDGLITNDTVKATMREGAAV